MARNNDNKNEKLYDYQSPKGSNGRSRYSLPGIPQRDIREKDWRRFSDEEKDLIKAAVMPDGKPLYKAATDKRKKNQKQDLEDGGGVPVEESVDDEPVKEEPVEAPVDGEKV